MGEKLQLLRKSRGLSQEQLAAELDVSRQAISKWECGDSTPDLDKLRAICAYFGVTTDHLIWENEEDAPKAAVPAKERASRGRNEVFSNVLLLVLLLAGIAALWSSLRISFANDAMVHIILAVAAIAAAILSFISAAAASVYVTTSSLSTSTGFFSSVIIEMILSTSTAVFPEPAAAETRIFLSRRSMTCRCSFVHFTAILPMSPSLFPAFLLPTFLYF